MTMPVTHSRRPARTQSPTRNRAAAKNPSQQNRCSSSDHFFRSLLDAPHGGNAILTAPDAWKGAGLGSEGLH
jgi:hypothetical protein